jgi:hypothetical protein
MADPKLRDVLYLKNLLAALLCCVYFRLFRLVLYSLLHKFLSKNWTLIFPSATTHISFTVCVYKAIFLIFASDDCFTVMHHQALSLTTQGLVQLVSVFETADGSCVAAEFLSTPLEM